MSTPMQAWPEIILRQEEILRFPQPISNSDALTLGLSAVELAKAFGQTVAIRIVVREAVAFSHLMDGLGLESAWWMDKKLNAAREMGMPTLRLYAEVHTGARQVTDFLLNETSYALDGGCVPLRARDGRIFGWFLVSGAPHQYDHEIATQAIARFLRADAPSVLDAT